jgi:hypothetical protein
MIFNRSREMCATVQGTFAPLAHLLHLASRHSERSEESRLNFFIKNDFFTIARGVFHQKRLFHCSPLEYPGEKVTAS